MGRSYMKIGCLLSVREKATRFPKKVLQNINGYTVTECLLKRLSLTKNIDQIIVSTSTNPGDEVLVQLAEANGFSAFRGSEEDKLARYYQTALHYNLDAVVIVDGDDLLCFPEGIDLIAQELRLDIAECIYLESLPLGAASTGLTIKALEKVISLKDENDTEVWGGYFIGSGYFKTKSLAMQDKIFNHPEIRLTLDYEEDYNFLKAVFSYFNCIDFTSYELMDLLINIKPELVKINEVAQKKYEQHIANAAAVKFKTLEEV
ncbi:TPA: hypothetical protein JBA25_14410 [Legionella pneumophila]|nr:hypothetical protein [Legionella pneumophila]